MADRRAPAERGAPPAAAPFGRWIRGRSRDGERGPLGSAEHPFVGFVYVDPQAGLSAKGGHHGPQGFRVNATLRLPLLELDWELLDDAAREGLGLPTTPDWLTYFGPQPDPSAPWRRDPAVVRALHPSFPDDAQVMTFDGDHDPEIVWVRLDGAEGSRFTGSLLSSPRAIGWLRQGDRVTAHHTGNGRLVALGPVERANDAGHRARCEECAFDLLVATPVAELVAALFPDAPKDQVLQAFTTRCVACGGGMIVERRASPTPGA